MIYFTWQYPCLQPQAIFALHITFFTKCKKLSYVLAMYMNHSHNLHMRGDYITL